MIKAAFIGAGKISTAHLRYLQSRKDVKIVGFAAPGRVNTEKRQAEFGGDIFSDYCSMLDRVKPDAVWLCTPSTVRREPLLECARRGIPVFCEKPVERHVKAGAAIAAELEHLKARVQVGYVFRYIPVVKELRRQMRGDRIHLVQSFYCCGISLTMDMPKWFYNKRLSGGALADQATHNFDLLRYLFGEVRQIRGMRNNPVRPRRGDYTIEEILGALMMFESGMIAAHVHTWVGDSWRNEIVLSGEKRIYRLQPLEGTLVVEGVSSRSANDPVAGKSGGDAKPAPYRYEQPAGSIYDYENQVFLKQVKSGDWSRNPCSYADGLKTLELTTACDRAISR
jgi:myo-inositol 2-dehydrogenase/D-chiro-inositol 1-dehydrogenase